MDNNIIRNVLFYFGDKENGFEPGNFTYHLLRCFQGADPGNFARLALGFPDHAEAMRTVMSSTDGMDELVSRLL